MFNIKSKLANYEPACWSSLGEALLVYMRTVLWAHVAWFSRVQGTKKTVHKILVLAWLGNFLQWRHPLATNVIWHFFLASFPGMRCLSEGVTPSDPLPPLYIFADARLKAFCSFVVEVCLAAVDYLCMKQSRLQDKVGNFGSCSSSLALLRYQCVFWSNSWECCLR